MNYAREIAGEEVAILPSLLAADFGNLEAAVRRAETAGADGLHLDIMDGHFVPNLSMGPDVVRMAGRCSRLPRNVHLMVSNPGDLLGLFVKAGADILLIHIEVAGDVAGMLREIRRLGARPGITLSPDTAAERIFGVLPLVDEVLCMTVHPGYGGQSFMQDMLPKIRAIRQRIRDMKLAADVSVDGGIDGATGPLCAAAGANVLIAGTSLYSSADMRSALAQLKSFSSTAFKAAGV
jgi:ribulose-phosphate 3-epimerase